MRRTDHGHVRKLACDLVGVGDRGSWRVEPHARPTAATAAKLAVIWAGTQDPALMAGVIRKKGPDRMEAARDLLSCGAEYWTRLDLLGDIAIPLRCTRAVHRLVLRADDSIDAASHPGMDLELESVAVSLGGQAPACVEEAERQVTPSADWSVPPAASEVLAFLRLCRSWLRAGFELRDTGQALDKRLSHSDLAAHLAAGLDVDRAVLWRSIPPGKALAWSELGFSPIERAAWRQQGRSYADARTATDLGGERVTRWAAVVDTAVSAEVLGEWAAWGEPTGVWGQLASHGLRPRDVPAWLEAFTPFDVLVYVRSGIDVAEAVRWKERGYRPSVATGFLTRGVTLEQAWALRGYPARVVQRVWHRAGSVEGVIEELERA